MLANLVSGRVFPNDKGFALIENLISIILLTIGSLGIAASTASTIRFNTDNQARAMALEVATKVVEPLYVAAEKPGVSDVDFGARVKALAATTATAGATPSSGGVAVYGNVAAGSSERFMVGVTSAFDANGTNVLTTAGPYVSPVTIAVLVSYQGNAGHQRADGTVEIADLQQARASYTYVLTQPGTAP